MDSVFLVWDDSRAEHDESATLVNIYGTREAADRHIERENEAFAEDLDEYIAEPPFRVEVRTVIG